MPLKKYVEMHQNSKVVAKIPVEGLFQGGQKCYH